MIADVIDTFKDTRLAFNQEFCIKKVNLRQIPITWFHIQKLVFQSCLSSLCHFAAQCLRSLHSKQRENEKVTATRCYN